MSQATDMLAAYLAAETNVLAGKEATVGNRRVALQDLPQIIKGRQFWESRVRAEKDVAAGRQRGVSLSGFSQ